MSGFSDYDKYDGLGLAGLVRKKEVKPDKLAEEVISRIERLNPRVNAVIHKMYERALKAAGGGPAGRSLQGCPLPSERPDSVLCWCSSD
jgi:amidase